MTTDQENMQFSKGSTKVVDVDIPNPLCKGSKGGIQLLEIDIPNPYCKEVEESRNCREEKENLKKDCKQEKDEIKKDCKKEKDEIKKECKDEKDQIKRECKDEKDQIKRECKDEKDQIKRECKEEKEQIKKECKKDCEDKIKEIKDDYEDKIKEIKDDCKEEKREIEENCKKDCEVEKQVIEEKYTHRPDCEAFKTLRDNIDSLVVKSVETGEVVGSVNPSCFYFEFGNLVYGHALIQYAKGVNIPDATIGKEGEVYLKVLPYDEERPYYKLGICNKNGQLIKQASVPFTSPSITVQETIKISKCNIVGGEKIELEDYFREDGKPTFIIKSSKLKEPGGFNHKFRAEVHKYDPDSERAEDLVGTLSSVYVGGVFRYGSEVRVNVHDTMIRSTIGQGHECYFTDKGHDSIKVVAKGDKYEMTPLYPASHLFPQVTSYSSKPIDTKTIKHVLDEVLCLCDRSVLEDGVQIVG